MERHDSAIFEDASEVDPKITNHSDNYHYEPKNEMDRFAKAIVHASARGADFLFKERYGERAIVLETIAAVPGMVGGLLQHLKSLRFIRDDRGWIKTLVDEAENERMHLIIYSQIAKPTTFERLLIMIVQFFFYHLYFVLYLVSPQTAHRTVGYFEEEAIASYHHYLECIDKNHIHNTNAPEIAKTYWNLAHDAKLRDVVLATIKDEIMHRDVNHTFANDKEGTHLWR
jgi:ubiquinol oxidase